MKLKQDEIDLLINKFIQNAAKQYIRRQDRSEHPDGKFDNAGRWYPDDIEELDTDMYRSPSRAYPYSYMLACRSLEHIAKLNGFSKKNELLAIKRIVRIFRADISIQEFISNNS